MFHTSTHIVVKQIFECLTHRNKICINAARLFYNDKNCINYFLQYLRNRQSMLELKGVENKIKERKKKKPPSVMNELYFNPRAPEVHDFLTFNLIEWWKKVKLYHTKNYQRYRYEQDEELGPDIATAKFVLNVNGRVKFANHDWIDYTNKAEVSKIPKEYQPDFILEGLDLRGYPIQYENLFIICNLHHLKWLILRSCDTINDWSLDRLAAEYPTLQHLDISECKNVTERGLEALYKMPNLDELIVTNFHNSTAFELTCYMLEEVNPYLKCHILKPEKELLLIHGHEKET